jgi:hypothetical protein
MTDSIIQQLIQGGSMGIFAAFLVWQHIGMQRRLDGLVERFQDQINQVDRVYDERVEALRTDHSAALEAERERTHEVEQKCYELQTTTQNTLGDLVGENKSLLEDILRGMKA